MKTFKLGVYIKPNGNLVSVEEDHDSDNVNYKYAVVDGRKANDGLWKLVKPKNRPYLILGSSSLNLGWGPSAFINKCEYLGEL